MPTSACEFPPINLHLPGASAVTSDIPIGLPTSPSSLDVDHEQLTVWVSLHWLHSFANLYSPESELFITLTTENLSLSVCPCYACLC